MANFIPTLISSGSLSNVSVSMAGSYSYESFIASMTSIFYMIVGIKIQGNTAQDVEQTFFFTLRNYTATENQDVNPFLKDPYQFQNQVEKFFSNNQYILNGQLSMQLTLFPNQSLNMYLYCIEFNPKDLLNNVFMKGRGYVFVSEIQQYLSDFKDKIEYESEISG